MVAVMSNDSISVGLDLVIFTAFIFKEGLMALPLNTYFPILTSTDLSTFEVMSLGTWLIGTEALISEAFGSS